MNKNLLLLLTPFVFLGCTQEQSNQDEAKKPQQSTAKIRSFNAPQSPVILTIDGSITQFNKEKSLLLDRDTLMSFQQQEVTTTTLWTDGKSTFSGPLLRDVLNSAGNAGKTISATAINEYTVQIPLADTHKYAVILALQKDGKLLSVREKGPIWVIYPWSSDEELKQDKYYSRSIWQLKKLTLHD